MYKRYMLSDWSGRERVKRYDHDRFALSGLVPLSSCSGKIFGEG